MVTALTDALDAHSRDLLRYLERRVGTADAADALAELMMAAWRRVDDLPAEPYEVRLWLFGVARHVVLNQQRGERRRWRLADRLRNTAERSQTDAADDGLEVRDAIARLEPELSELVRAVHWDGFTIAEAAAILGLNPSTARSRYQRAKEELRAALSSELPAR